MRPRTAREESELVDFVGIGRRESLSARLVESLARHFEPPLTESELRKLRSRP